MNWTQQDAPLMDALKEHLTFPDTRADGATMNWRIFSDSGAYRST